MTPVHRYPTLLTGAMILALFALAPGCGRSGTGSRSPILGIGVGTTGFNPAVTSVSPANLATDAALTTIVRAGFNEPMAPISGSASFTLTTTAPGIANPDGTVALDASNRVAQFTLAPGTILHPLTLYTATITGARALASGLALPAPYTWSFSTGALPSSGAPTVSTVVPAAGSTGVALNTTILSASFSEVMAPITGGASFVVTSSAGTSAGTVALDPSGRIASFTLGTQLAPLTLYTATLTGARSLATGLALASPYSWSFTTGTVTSATRPGVSLTVPATTLPGPTPDVPANAALVAVFSQEMAPATIHSGSFRVTCPLPDVAPAGLVTYTIGDRSAVFSPLTAFTPGTTYTVTLSQAVTNVAGIALAGNQGALPAASDYVWSFTAGAPAAAAPLGVLATSPAAGTTGVSPSASINATFQVPGGLRMDPATLHSASFALTGPAPANTPVLAASVLLDTGTGTVATFTPLAPLAAGLYTATLGAGATGVADLAVPADTLASAFQWSFTVGTTPALAAIDLGTLAPFGNFGGSAGTTNTGLFTVIDGNIGTLAASTLVTGFHDGGVGNTYTETPLNVGLVNGRIYTAAPSPSAASIDEGNAATYAIALQGQADALAAYNALVAKPSGADPGAGNLGSLVLAPGVYTSLSGTFLIQGGDLTLDAQGDGNAVWVFQMAKSLTVGGPGAAFPQSVLLVNGAQARNVFWQVGSAATINAAGGGTMAGTIISQAGAAFSTYGNTAIVTLNGRAVSLGASITLVNTVIHVPAN